MWNSAQDLYLEQRVLSAGPLELVRLQYDAAIAAVRAARHSLAAGEIAGRSRAISKAAAILLELNAALDHARGGAISGRLANLYGYLLARLLEANLQQSDPPLAEVLGLLSTLAEGWKGIQQPEAAVFSSWPLSEQPVGPSGAQVWNL